MERDDSLNGGWMDWLPRVRNLGGSPRGAPLVLHLPSLDHSNPHSSFQTLDYLFENSIFIYRLFSQLTNSFKNANTYSLLYFERGNQ